MSMTHDVSGFIANRTGASPGNFFIVSGTARMVPAEAPKMLIGSTQSVSVDKTLKAALLVPQKA